ncbi:MAG: PQQ-dependent sugar dehydrogenase [Planctomycetes bacterium]|nr:PQQ-dependent sugar dehydrogenase [Planctomycetota bacterium]
MTGFCTTAVCVAAATLVAGEGSHERRVPWTTSRVTGSPEPPPPYRVERVFSKLQFQQPVVLTTAPGSDRWFLVELDGRVYSFPNEPDCQAPDLFFDAKEHVDGLRRVYGMAFHPRFAENGQVFICYVLDENLPEGTRVSRFRVVEGSDPPRIDPAGEDVIITWRSGGHNGGCLKFGPDGYLYISTGDAANPSPPDVHDTGQNVGDLLASILRIDVDARDDGRAYRVPPDNPFVDVAGARPEVWAYGFRNPWKMSVDSQTGELWVGDVGWEMWEMVYRVQKGGNYGWSIVEGSQSVRPEAARGPTPILPPVTEHSHIESRSITGGFMYRGDRLPRLHGAYIYGDYVTGLLWALKHDGRRVVWHEELCDTPLAIIGFGEWHDGELVVVGYDGSLNRLVANEGPAANADFPQTLSETGLFASVADHQPATGVIDYSIRAEPWADGARAERLIGVPGRARLAYQTANNVQVGLVRGHFDYPSDTVFAKTLSLQTAPSVWRRIETQLLHRDGDTWRAYTYAWNDDGSDATLVPAEGLDRTFAVVAQKRGQSPEDLPSEERSAAGGGQSPFLGHVRQTWRYAARTECLVCHTTRAGSIHGFNPAQLDRTHEREGANDHQLRALVRDGLFDAPGPALAALGVSFPELHDPHVESLPLEERARSYLHVNCAHCHRRGGGGTAKFELRKELPLGKTLAVGERPSQGTFDIYGAEVIAPGDPYRSVLLYRMAKLGGGRMPHIGSSVVDERGVRLIRDWIASLAALDGAESGGGTDPVEADRHADARGLIESLRVGNVEPRSAIERLLSSTRGAHMLSLSIADDALPESVRAAAIDAGAKHAAPAVNDLFERFVPEEARTRRLGATVRPDEILALAGNAARGRELFDKAADVSCRNCHRIGEVGREVGPDLTSLARKQSPAELLEGILDPSKRIAPEFVTYLVETKRGRVHSGLLVKRGDDGVVIKDAEGKLLELSAGEVELLVPQKKSLMPELLLRDLTTEQVADLLAYLTSLR